MGDIQHFTDSMLEAAGAVLGRLVDHPIASSGTSRKDHQGSIKIDADSLVTCAQVPSLGVKIVVRFASADVAQIVNLMLGGGDDGGEMGAMQLSIVSETVSQIAAAMAEELAKNLNADRSGIRADLCTDATNLPPPPFASYEGTIQVGSEVTTHVAIDFDGIAVAKIGGFNAAEEPVIAAAHATAATVQAAAAPAAAAKPARRQVPAPAAQPVSFAPMAPTTARSPLGGNNLDLVHDVPLQISAVLGKTALTLRDVVTLSSGSVFELDKLSTDPIDLYVNNILIARGEVVVVDDKFAVKISELNPSVE